MTMTLTEPDSGLTATVEVLTAEVRTLVVGNRQVTQSVYRQLDHINPEAIEPFGRVNDTKAGEGYDVLVVGRGPDGVLVRSGLPWNYGKEWDRHERAPEALGILWRANEHLTAKYVTFPSERDHVKVAEHDDLTVAWALRDGGAVNARRYQHDPELPEGAIRWLNDEVRAEAARLAQPVVLGMAERRDRREEWLALPLIVLAGLR
jgi:hypothetical protein